MWMPITALILSVIGISLCFLSRRRSITYTNEEMRQLAHTCQFYDPSLDECLLCKCICSKMEIPITCSYTHLHDSSKCPIIHPEITDFTWPELLDLWFEYTGDLNSNVQKD